MNLTSGQQLQNSGQSLYEVDELLTQKDNSSIYSGRRCFLNYKYQDRQFYYAARDEQAKVLIKVPAVSNNEDDLKRIALEYQYECKNVLARHSVWFPQIIDYFDLSFDKSEQADNSQKVPLLVFDRPYIGDLSGMIMTDQLSPVDRVQLSIKLIDFFEAIQNQGQYCSGVSLDGFKLGTNLRLQCLLSERIADRDKPAEVNSTQTGITFAPELKANPTTVMNSTDLYHWALLSVLMVGGEKSIQELHACDGNPVFSKSLLKEVQQVFVTVSGSNRLNLRPLSPEHYQKKAKLMVKGLGFVVSSCLHVNPKKRPSSFKELRKKASQSSSGGLRKILNPFS